MKKQNTKIRQEKGITLISLIVTIVILVIIAGATISQLTGDSGIIGTTETATEDYKVAQYEEQVEELFQSTILEYDLLAEDITTYKIAEEMGKESWITSAERLSETTVKVTVVDGYVYQVYYNPDTGDKLVGYIGLKDKGEFPTITATYDSSSNKITVNASCTDGIDTIELMHSGVVIDNGTYSAGGSTSVSHSFSVSETGIYTAEVTTSKGITGYAYVRVTSEGAATPTITLDGTQGSNGWYTANLTATITVTSSSGFYYKTSNDSSYTYVSGTSKTITISEQGRTIIYAYSVDSSNNQSKIVSTVAKYDSVKPTITAANINTTGTKGADGTWWTTDVVISFEDAITDATSGVAGYKYYLGTDSSSISSVIDISKTLTITGEGERVLKIIGVDSAGLETSTSTLTIDKDSLAPVVSEVTISDITDDGFTILMTATDDTSKTTDVSGMSYYEVYINDVLYDTVDVSGNVDPSATLDVTGLDPDTTYTVSVLAYDSAGNHNDASSSTVKAVQTDITRELQAPTITLSGTQGNNNYYTSVVTVVITDSADSSISSCEKIVYEITGANEISEQTISGKSTSFTIGVDGTSVITAYAMDSSGNTSSTKSVTVYKDATAPVVDLTLAATSTTAITATATATENTSGIASYKFQYSSTSSTSGYSTATTETDASSLSKSYTNLTAGGTYYFKVTVTDNAGNSATSVVRSTEELASWSGTSSTTYTWNKYSYVSTYGTLVVHSSSSSLTMYSNTLQYNSTYCYYWNSVSGRAAYGCYDIVLWNGCYKFRVLNNTVVSGVKDSGEPGCMDCLVGLYVPLNSVTGSPSFCDNGWSSCWFYANQLMLIECMSRIYSIRYNIFWKFWIYL